jgi:hypothetical protein
MQKQSITREKQYPIYVLTTFSKGKMIPSYSMKIVRL